MFGSMPLNIDPSLMQIGKVKRGGMFGNADWASAIGALLAGASGSPVGVQALQMLNQRMMQKREDAQYQQRRGDELADYGKKLEMQAQYKQPEYGEFERALIASGVQPGTPQWQEKMGTRANNMLDPMTMTIYGPMPRSALMGAQAPAKPLTDDDILRMQGGPTPQASGGFPGSY